MTLEKTVGKLLLEKSLTLGLAESCTGGLVAARITSVPGSSAYFMAGFVTYSNRAKTRFLSVPEKIIVRHGAVSSIVAGRMAKGVCDVAEVDIGLSITGIAGPAGGSPEKPVGTVFMALATGKHVLIQKFLFSGSRSVIRKQASDAALRMLLVHLEGRAS